MTLNLNYLFLEVGLDYRSHLIPCTGPGLVEAVTCNSTDLTV